MKNRKAYIGVVSIMILPLAIYLALPVIIKLSNKNCCDDFLSQLALNLLYFGWIVGLMTGIKGIKETATSRNGGKVNLVLKAISIIGTITNFLWMSLMFISLVRHFLP